MKKYAFGLVLIFAAMLACKTPSKPFVANDKPILNDTVKIKNDKLEYEVIIIDPGFSSWFNSYAKPRNYYSQSYLEARNRVWVSEYNIRAINPIKYGEMYEMRIDYDYNIDYGYEVNYMLFNYLTYFQLANRQKLGGFAPHI